MFELQVHSRVEVSLRLRPGSVFACLSASSKRFERVAARLLRRDGLIEERVAARFLVGKDPVRVVQLGLSVRSGST
jgi:hypothetical protein